MTPAPRPFVPPVRRGGFGALVAALVIGILSMFLPQSVEAAPVAPSSAGARMFDPGGFDLPAAAAGASTVAAGGTVTAVTAAGGGFIIAGAAVFVTAFAGTTAVLKWVDPSDDPPGIEEAAGVVSSDVIDCPPLTFEGKCVRVSAAQLPYLGNPWVPDSWFWNRFGMVSNGGASGVFGTVNVQWNTQPGVQGYFGDSASGSFPSGYTSGKLWALYPVNCVLTPTCGIRPGQAIQFRPYATSIGYADTVYGAARVSPQFDESGYRLRYRSQAGCRGASLTSYIFGTSAEFWAAEADSVSPQTSIPACPAGTRLTSITTWQQTVGGASYSPQIGDRQIFTWAYPTVAPANQPTVDRCLTDLNCKIQPVPATDTEPEACLWGGDAVPLAWCDSFQTIEDPAPVTTTTLSPSTSTTAITTTTAVTTTTTPTTTTTQPPPPLDPPPPPGDPEGPFSFSGCMSDQFSAILDSINLNPLTWVRGLLYGMVFPIYCALLWLFVPPEGFQAVWEQLKSPVEDSPVLEPLRNLFGGLGISTCLPLIWNEPRFFGSAGATIDVGLCGNVAIAGLWTLFFGLAVIGMANDVLNTVANFRKKSSTIRAQEAATA